MRRRLADLLVCPRDGSSLELVVWEARAQPLTPAQHHQAEAMGIDARLLEEDIVSGALVNRRSQIAYPIFRGVPRMLCFRTGLADEFLRQFGSRMGSELDGYKLSAGNAKPGERDVLRTFSTEWTSYDWDGKSYWNLDPEAWFRSMRFVLDLEQGSVKHQRLLEIGIGVGGVADHNAKHQEAEVVGVDLGYAVDAAYRNFGAQNPFLHVVQASVFDLPFRPSEFDYVYSFGVLHHTHSTKDAVSAAAVLPRDGGRLFVWVYSPEDEARNIQRRVLMRLERLLRPILWRLPAWVQTAALLPILPLYMVNQVVRKMKRSEGSVGYGFREALHAARDRFTPRFVHRHDAAEVSSWFESLGYGNLRSISDWPRPSWLPEAFVACTGIHGVRASAANHRGT